MSSIRLSQKRDDAHRLLEPSPADPDTVYAGAEEPPRASKSRGSSGVSSIIAAR